eukprot:3548918-Prymnesium_polylepis.2
MKTAPRSGEAMGALLGATASGEACGGGGVPLVLALLVAAHPHTHAMRCLRTLTCPSHTCQCTQDNECAFHEPQTSTPANVTTSIRPTLHHRSVALNLST